MLYYSHYVLCHCLYFYPSLNFFTISNCFECNIPSKDRSVKADRREFFSQLIMEKSDSTVAVLENTVAKPPQNSFKC